MMGRDFFKNFTKVGSPGKNQSADALDRNDKKKLQRLMREEV
jgi:hypothetical protein